jgi:CHAT domain-containing protein/Tfp pilus assembly protein PilF
MKQRRLGLGLSIVLLIAGVKLEILTVGQTLRLAPSLDNEKLVEAERLNQQVIKLYNQGKYDEAIPLAQRSLAIREKALGTDHPNVATSLNNLALLYDSQGKYAQAEPLHQRSLAILEKVLGTDHLDFASSLNNLAELYRNQGKYAQAEPLAKRSLAILEKVLGTEHPSVATSLNNLAVLYLNQGKYAQAEPLYQRSLAILEKALGTDHPNVATSLNNLALLYLNQGKYAQAEPLYQRSLAILEKVLGTDHPSVATSLNNLAVLYLNQGKYAQAEPLYQRSLAILEKVLGTEHASVATSLNNLAVLYRNQGKYAQAEPLYQRSLAISEKVLGTDHPDIATSLNNLALLYDSQGKYAQAEPLYQRSLAILEKALGTDHPKVATSLDNLALLYNSQGKYAQAEILYQRSLAIREKALGTDHPDIATSLNNLALLYDSQGKYAQAEPLYQRSLAILEKALGTDHPKVATSLDNLALLYNSQGKYAQAEILYQRSLAIREKALGTDHPDFASSLNNLAGLYLNQGKYAQAEPLYQRSLAIREKALEADHPDIASSLNNLAGLYLNQGKHPQAVELHGRGSVIQENILSKTLVIGSEQDKKDYVDNISTGSDFSISLAIKSNRSDADRLALTNVFRRQGRILDATAATIQNIRTRLKERPDLQELFDNWQTTLQAQADLTTSQLSQKDPPAYKTRYQELAQRGQLLETQLSKQSATFRQTIAPIELAKIQTLIPSDAALVHLVKYQPFNPKGGATNRFGAPRYAAVTLRTTGNPHWVDLGTAAEIETNIQTFRTYLQDGSTTNNLQRNKIARTLHTQLIQPLHQHLGDTKHLLLSPDAALNLIPFEALQDENNKYLIERYAFSYLTSGRDLTRFADAPPSRQAPVIFSEINYDRSTNYSPLATAAETTEIQRIFPNAELKRDRAATKAALQKIQAPQILHLATHGFFKPAPNNPENPKQLDNPLTRSGIILAGTDQLTGLEASALDLYGTQLVVLSACETGLGDISAGEGIYGLRRALVIAGSQSQVLSLWKVENNATVELMKIFYQNLKTGMGRHEALRDAQLKLLRHPNYQNPYNWAAFIPSGNWEPLPKS